LIKEVDFSDREAAWPSSLRELLIYTESDQDSHNRRDSLLLSQLSTVCFNLSSLKLEVALNVSSAELISLFTSMSQLRPLWLGSELRLALGNDALTAISMMSRLNHLFLDQSLDSSFWKELPTVSKGILPRANKLQIKFPTSEGLVIGELLSMISTLKDLVVTVVAATAQRTTMLHPACLCLSCVGSRYTCPQSLQSLSRGSSQSRHTNTWSSSTSCLR